MLIHSRARHWPQCFPEIAQLAHRRVEPFRREPALSLGFGLARVTEPGADPPRECEQRHYKEEAERDGKRTH